MQAAVLGNAGCGKTSLIRALVGMKFDPNSPPTERRTSFRAALSHGQLFATFIDCGHIEDEDALHDLLVGSKVNCVLLTYDLTNPSSLESIKTDWLDAVLASRQKFFLMLVGLKCDEKQGAIRIRNDQVLDFANERNLFSIQVSAKTGENISLLLDVLQSRLGGSDAAALHTPKRQTQPWAEQQQQQREEATAGFPLLVDIKTGSVSGTITVHSREEDPVVLARQFLVRHGLDVNRAEDLARVVEMRIQEFFQEEPLPRQQQPQQPAPPRQTLANRSNGRSMRILARLTVVVDAETMAVVVVREGDECARVVEAFRRTYDLPKGDPVLDELADRVVHALETGAEEDEDLKSLVNAGEEEEVETRAALRRRSEAQVHHVAPVVSAPAAVATAVPTVSTRDKIVREERPRPPQAQQPQPRRRGSSVEDDQPPRPQQQQQPRRSSVQKSAVHLPPQTAKPVVLPRHPYPEDDGDLEEFEEEKIAARTDYQKNHSLARRRGSQQQQQQTAPRSPIISPARRKQPQQVYASPDEQEEDEEDHLSSFEEEDEYDDLAYSAVSVQAVPPPPSRYYHHRTSASAPPPPPRSNYTKGRHLATQSAMPPPPPPPSRGGRISTVASTNTLKRMPNLPPPPPPSRYGMPLISRSALAAPSPTTQPRYLNSTAASRSFYSVNTPSTLQQQHQYSSRPILFYVDVNLGGKTERISVCKGDNLEQLAERFLEEHRLPKTKLGKLTQLLDVHWKQHQRNRRTLL